MRWTGSKLRRNNTVSLIAGLVSVALLAEPAVANPVSNDRSPVKLDLVVNHLPNSFPASFRVQVTNLSEHPVVGGALRLVFTVVAEPATQATAGGPTCEWGEFRLGPGETTIRELKGDAVVFEGEHGDKWSRAAFVGLLARSDWTLFAIAADETGPDPPTVRLGSQVYEFEPHFKMCSEPSGTSRPTTPCSRRQAPAGAR